MKRSHHAKRPKNNTKKDFTYASPSETLKRVQASHALPTLEVNIAACMHTDVLYPPPTGHLGVYAAMEIPTVKLPEGGQRQLEAGDKIVFMRFMDEKLMGGTVTGIEHPGSCLRPDMQKFLGWYKIHWVPNDDETIKWLHRALSINDCPKCGTHGRVYATRPANGKRLRFRKCSKCKTKWTTVETYVGTIDESPASS